MKRKNIFAVILLAAILLTSLVGCGFGFDSVRRAMESGGYTYFFPVGEEEIITTISRELAALGFEFNIHYFKKSASPEMGVTVSAIAAVIELKNGKIETIFNDPNTNTLRAIIEDYPNSKQIRGNIILVPLTSDGRDDMIKAFNG